MSKKKNKSNKNKIEKSNQKSTNDHAKKELYAKLGITEDVINNDEKIIEQEKAKKDSTKHKQELSKQELDKEIGWKNPKALLLNFLYGIFMAISDAIPGYSGGTTLSIIGFYDKLISRAKNIFSPEVKGTWWKYLLWIIPFILAWIGFLILILFLVHKISDAEKGIVLVFLFGSFAIFSIPFFYLTNKNKLPSFVSSKFKTFNDKYEKKSNRVNLILMIFGLLLIVIFAIVIRTALGGVSFLPEENDLFNNVESSDFDMGQVFITLGAGFLAGFFMFIPGVSGSLMLYLCNIYPKVSGSIAEILNGTTAGINNIPYLMTLLIGAVAGIVVSILLVNWISKKWRTEFYSLCLGFVCASFMSIFISLSSNDYATLKEGTTLGISLAMIPVAALINVGIFFALNQTKLINFPKFYIKTKKDSVVN